MPDLARFPLVTTLQASMRRHDVLHRGRHVCWRTVGQGPPLVLLHGGHGSWLHWVRNIDALSQHHALWLADMPGFGDSQDLDLDPLAEDRLARLVEALVETLNALVGPTTPVDLAGFSFGALVASQFAGARGALRRVALIGPSRPDGASPLPPGMRPWRLPDRSERLAALRHNLRVLMLYEAWAHDDQALALHEAACLAARFRTQGLRIPEDVKAALDRAACPLLLVWGAHDVVGRPEAVTRWLSARRRGVECCVVPAAGHWVQYEQPVAANEILSRWFEGRRPVGQPWADGLPEKETT